VEAEVPQTSPMLVVRFRSPAMMRFTRLKIPLFAILSQKSLSSVQGPYVLRRDICWLFQRLVLVRRIPPLQRCGVSSKTDGSHETTSPPELPIESAEVVSQFGWNWFKKDLALSPVTNVSCRKIMCGEVLLSNLLNEAVFRDPPTPLMLSVSRIMV
jgi:hypothetical protein